MLVVLPISVIILPDLFDSRGLRGGRGERNASRGLLGCTELRCHGHSADNRAHSSSCRLNTIKPDNKHLGKLRTVSELILSPVSYL